MSPDESRFGQPKTHRRVVFRYNKVRISYEWTHLKGIGETLTGCMYNNSTITLQKLYTISFATVKSVGERDAHLKRLMKNREILRRRLVDEKVGKQTFQ